MDGTTTMWASGIVVCMVVCNVMCNVMCTKISGVDCDVLSDAHCAL